MLSLLPGHRDALWMTRSPVAPRWHGEHMDADRPCSRCRRTLPTERFARKGKDGAARQPWCRDCKAEYQRAWYQRNRERHIRNVRLLKQRQEVVNRRIIQQAKDVPCGDCGCRYPPWVMDFDHVRGRKAGNVGEMLSAGTPALQREIAKCEVVCANCHRQRTHDRRRSTPPTASEHQASYDAGHVHLVRPDGYDTGQHDGLVVEFFVECHRHSGLPASWRRCSALPP